MDPIKRVKGRGPKIVRDCPICGSKFEALAYKVRKGLSKYCSQKCCGQAHKDRSRIRGECLNCGKAIEFVPSRPRQYCSVTCMTRHTAADRGRAISATYAAMPDEKKREHGRKISATKRKRIKEDPKYLARLRAQMIRLGGMSSTEEAKAKRRKTIAERYSEEERRAWYSAGGRANAEQNDGPWNKGLTKETDERVAAQAKQLMGHEPAKGSGRGKSGRRADIDLYCRSTWEADVARVLNHLGIAWRYEPRVFEFRDREGRTIDTYRPDFHLPDLDVWLEVSGWTSEQKKRRLRLFRRQYPDENMLHIDRAVYAGLHRIFSPVIPGWEGKRRGDGDCGPLLEILDGGA